MQPSAAKLDCALVMQLWLSQNWKEGGEGGWFHCTAGGCHKKRQERKVYEETFGSLIEGFPIMLETIYTCKWQVKINLFHNLQNFIYGSFKIKSGLFQMQLSSYWDLEVSCFSSKMNSTVTAAAGYLMPERNICGRMWVQRYMARENHPIWLHPP